MPTEEVNFLLVRRNGTTDTRIFSIQLSSSTEFSIDPNGLCEVRFEPMQLLCLF